MAIFSAIVFAVLIVLVVGGIWVLSKFAEGFTH